MSEDLLNPSPIEQTQEYGTVIQAAYEVLHQPEHVQDEQRSIIDELLENEVENGVLGLDQRIQAMQAFDSILGRLVPKDEQGSEKPMVSVDFSRIGWSQLQENGTVAGEKVDASGLTYTFVDLTGYNAATLDCKEALAVQMVKGQPLLPKLMERVKSTVIPQLYDGIKHGKNLRPISRGVGNREKTVATTYPAYKEGVQGTNNRAILLLLDDGPDGTVFGLAALYDHDDDEQIYRALE
jgi:hypothetical protein